MCTIDVYAYVSENWWKFNGKWCLDFWKSHLCVEVQKNTLDHYYSLHWFPLKRIYWNRPSENEWGETIAFIRGNFAHSLQEIFLKLGKVVRFPGKTLPQFSYPPTLNSLSFSRYTVIFFETVHLEKNMENVRLHFRLCAIVGVRSINLIKTHFSYTKPVVNIRYWNFFEYTDIAFWHIEAFHPEKLGTNFIFRHTWFFRKQIRESLCDSLRENFTNVQFGNFTRKIWANIHCTEWKVWERRGVKKIRPRKKSNNFEKLRKLNHFVRGGNLDEISKNSKSTARSYEASSNFSHEKF